jgi:hypothetical protein
MAPQAIEGLPHGVTITTRCRAAQRKITMPVSAEPESNFGGAA